MTPAPLLRSLASRGVTLRAEGGKLVAAPREALTDADRAWLREHKDALLRILASDDPEREAALDEYGRMHPYDFPEGPVGLRTLSVFRLGDQDGDLPPVVLEGEEAERHAAWLAGVKRWCERRRDQAALAAKKRPIREKIAGQLTITEEATP
jgi:hypothetical protein